MGPGDEIIVCAWRVVKAEPSGMFMWFDPTCEEPRLVRAEAPEAPHPIVKNVTPCEFGESMELWEPDGVLPKHPIR